jgi:hypothetical protein
MRRVSVVFERPTRPPDRRPPEPAGEFSIDDEPDWPTDGLVMGSDIDGGGGALTADPGPRDHRGTRNRRGEHRFAPRMPKKAPFAQLDERTQARLRASQEEFHRAWRSIPPKRLHLVRRAAAAKTLLEHIEWLLENEMVEELEELLDRRVPAVAAFGMKRVAVTACRNRLREILNSLTAENFPEAEGDEFRLARLERVRLLQTTIDRAIASANQEAELDESRRQMAGEELEVDDETEMLKIIYGLSRENRELGRRRAQVARDDASPWTAADRARLTRIRKDANEQFATRRRVT